MIVSVTDEGINICEECKDVRLIAEICEKHNVYIDSFADGDVKLKRCYRVASKN